MYCKIILIFCRVKEKKEELMPWQTSKILKTRVDQEQTVIPDPSESSVHGKEIHVAKQQQTQKEVGLGEMVLLKKRCANFFKFFSHSGTR